MPCYYYMYDYKTELELMFEQGKVNSSQKMNAAKMREQLCNKYPYKFSIPSETEIKNSLDPSFRSKKILAQLMMIRTIRIPEAEGLVQNLCGLLYWSLWWWLPHKQNPPNYWWNSFRLWEIPITGLRIYQEMSMER